ncbi:Gldg family protein [Eilatimonas milleporae]|uniref:ABC-type uncharacterized transport system involved in gliding motility auxiliary subunit n=1 Tax=Eilatimonas milleporae TaxID=911205 RepID=A0A3M0C3W0_9PROT|nr:Gldg family protein [Eilatimonas milleporae]RMB01506.1 ABC-type uncharacterized transport system involved in gliding motility auxiliary subunit [Eilatimonas milleporae]
MAGTNRFLNRPASLIAMGVLLFLSLTILSDRFLRGIDLDLTADGLYSLSDGTRTVLGDLEEPVRLDLYFSKGQAAPFPQLLTYGKRIEDLLRTLESAARGKVELTVIDPEPFSEDEDAAVAAGLRGIPLGDGSMLYLGLVARDTVDGEAIIPFFAEERARFLEYDLIKLITTLDQPVLPKLTLLTRLPMQFGPGGPQAMMQGRARPYVIYEQLREFFDVSEIAGDFAEIPDDTDLLMVVHPPALGEDQLFAIDQFVLTGKPALVFLDPHNESSNPASYEPDASDLGPLLTAWGIDISSDHLVADLGQAQRVSMGGYGPDAIKDYVLWIGTRGSALAEDDVVTAMLDSVTLASTGHVELLDGASTTLSPLISSSDQAMLVDVASAVGTPDPDSLLRGFEPSGKPYVLLGRVSGQANTAYPERMTVDTPAAGAGINAGRINLVVGADTDMFDDRFWVQVQDLFGQRISVPIAGNGSLILNLADQMAGSEALLDLRARGIARRPFEVVDRLRREAEARYLDEEQRLQRRLQETEARLAEMESERPEDGAIFSPEQEQAVDRFRAELVETRKALRDVKRNLRRDIERLGAWLAGLNILLMPVLVIFGAFVHFWRARRRRLAEIGERG